MFKKAVNQVKINHGRRKRNSKIKTPTHNASHNVAGKQEEFESDELLSGKALEDDFELDEDLDRLPI